MKKKHKSFLIIAGITLIAFFIPIIIFFLRSPVLIVSEQYFERLYGEERIKSENRRISLALFRPFKSVSVANDTGSDIVSLAVSDFSDNPFCVIFPFRFADAARLYREQNPHVPVVLLTGSSEYNDSFSDDLHIFNTDINDDFYRAGLAAASIVEMAERAKSAEAENSGEEPVPNRSQRRLPPPQIVVFLEKDNSQARDAFLKAVNDYEPPLEKAPREASAQTPETEDSGSEGRVRVIPNTQFFTSFSQFNETFDLSCIVIVDTGAEYFEKKLEIPVIFFTWLDLFLVPDDTALVIDGSPFAQAVQAVNMVRAGDSAGLISSKFHFMKIDKFDRETLRKIR